MSISMYRLRDTGDGVNVDCQLGRTTAKLEHGTRAAIPGMGFPEEPGCFVNRGEDMGVGEDWVTVAALIAAGR